MPTNYRWSAASPILDVAAGSQEPALAATSNALHAVWASNKLLYHARRVNGSWERARRFASGERPALAAGADGSLYCAFSHWFLGNSEIYITRWEGAAWSLPQLISRTSGVSTDPALCIDQGGGVHIVWADTTPGTSVIYHARPHDDRRWSNEPIPNGAGTRPCVAVTPAGEILVAWQDRLANTGYFETFCASCHSGVWSLPQIISDNPHCHSINPALAVNRQGSSHMVWQEEREGKYVIRHVERLPQGWVMPADISAAGSDARLPRIVAAARGFFQVVWVEGPVLKHRARMPELKSPWREEEIACEGCGSVSGLAIAIAPKTGDLHTLWSASLGAERSRLYHACRAPMVRQTVFMPIVVNSG